MAIGGIKNGLNHINKSHSMTNYAKEQSKAKDATFMNECTHKNATFMLNSLCGQNFLKLFMPHIFQVKTNLNQGFRVKEMIEILIHPK